MSLKFMKDISHISPAWNLMNKMISISFTSSHFNFILFFTFKTYIFTFRWSISDKSYVLQLRIFERSYFTIFRKKKRFTFANERFHKLTFQFRLFFIFRTYISFFTSLFHKNHIYYICIFLKIKCFTVWK